MNRLRTLIAAIAIALPGSGFAHHSFSPYDLTRMLQTSGVVKQIDFMNPHSKLVLTIDAEGGPQDVTFEGHSLVTLRHYGLTPSMVKIGDRISISYAPRRDDRPGGIFLIINTAAGKSLDFSRLGYD